MIVSESVEIAHHKRNPITACSASDLTGGDNEHKDQMPNLDQSFYVPPLASGAKNLSISLLPEIKLDSDFNHFCTKWSSWVTSEPLFSGLNIYTFRSQVHYNVVILFANMLNIACRSHSMDCKEFLKAVFYG